MSLPTLGFQRSLLAALVLACGSASSAQINPDLAAVARSAGATEALIVLPDQSTPTLSSAVAGADYKAQRRALVAALRQRADKQQAGVRGWLAARGIPFHAYWVANVVEAKLSATDLAALATRHDVSRVEPNPTFKVSIPPTELLPALAPENVDTIPWGVSKINAPQVWAAGFTGQGIVIGGEDTGYQWDHPALKPQYRGWNGTKADHNYNWHDSIHVANASCPADSPAPCDDFGHGTHTAGTFAGDDHGSNQIGVAPGARWVGCRNMNDGAGTPASYIECMQWMLAPTDLKGKNPNPDLAPDVISNSWTCPASEGCTVGNELNHAVTNLTAAGIMYVMAAANAGPNCETITDPPAIYGTGFTIGATDINDRLAGFSSRGPVTKDPMSNTHQTKPDVSAPGVNVFSAWPPNTYTNLSGTSMATPHTAGAAALLMSAVPALKGHPLEVARLLRVNAATAGVTDPVNQVCGGTASTTWPNNMLGSGRVDVYAAYQAAVAEAPALSAQP